MSNQIMPTLYILEGELPKKKDIPAIYQQPPEMFLEMRMTRVEWESYLAENYNEALAYIKSKLLRVELDGDKLGFFLYKFSTGLSDELARDNWTAKHFQDKSKNKCYEQAQAIIDYLIEEAR